MGKKLYVSNLTHSVTEEQIRELFGQAGNVESVKLMTGGGSGLALRAGYVEMATEEEAKKAIEQLNGQTLLERQIVVKEALLRK